MAIMVHPPLMPWEFMEINQRLQAALGGLEFMEILQMEAVPITMGSLVLRLILQQVEDVLMVLGDMLKELLMVIIMVFMETHQTILTRVREYLELRPEIIM